MCEIENYLSFVSEIRPADCSGEDNFVIPEPPGSLLVQLSDAVEGTWALKLTTTVVTPRQLEVAAGIVQSCMMVWLTQARARINEQIARPETLAEEEEILSS